MHFQCLLWMSGLREPLRQVNFFLETLGVRFLAVDVTKLPVTMPSTFPASCHNHSYVPSYEYRQLMEWEAGPMMTQSSYDYSMHRRLDPSQEPGTVRRYAICYDSFKLQWRSLDSWGLIADRGSFRACQENRREMLRGAARSSMPVPPASFTPLISCSTARPPAATASRRRNYGRGTRSGFGHVTRRSTVSYVGTMQACRSMSSPSSESTFWLSRTLRLHQYRRTITRGIAKTSMN